ncbi:tetratricopeptide repeat protein [Rhizobium sp. LjRoot258]|uniref:tetratricopeptide repeat protein n=1 Tax=Rhizobium sp. LjRoot258 TaxID=3342299 RepID=UPI003ECDB825
MDEIIERVAATVSGRIEQSELAAARLKRPENMTAHEYYLRGLDHHRLTGVSDIHIHEAMAWFERSMTADPGFGRPFAMHVCSWSNLPSFDLHRAEQQVAHALALDPTDPEAHRIMAAIKMKSGDFVSARYHHSVLRNSLRTTPIFSAAARRSMSMPVSLSALSKCLIVPRLSGPFRRHDARGPDTAFPDQTHVALPDCCKHGLRRSGKG